MTMSPYGEPQDVQPAGNDLVQWALEASDVHRVAQILATTQFVPKALQGRPDDIAATILYGRELNLPPMVSLQQINMIEGRPSLSALSMRGMAQAAGVKFRYEEQTESRCKMSALAPGDGQWTTVTWTMDQAKKLELATKRNWIRQPGAMLIARATSQLCRLVAAPLYMGMSYSTEELSDGSQDLTANVEHQPAAPVQQEQMRTVRRAPVKAKASVPVPAPDPEPEPEPQQEPDLRTKLRLREARPLPVPEKKGSYTPSQGSYSTEDVPQRPLGEMVERPNMVGSQIRNALMASFNEAGIKDRSTRLAYVSDLLGREVDSVNQITDDEGRQILEQLAIDRLGKPPTAEEATAVVMWDDVEVAKVPADG